MMVWLGMGRASRYWLREHETRRRHGGGDWRGEIHAFAEDVAQQNF